MEIKKRTFAEVVGEKNAVALIRYFAEGRKLKDVIVLMPKANFTIGKLAGLRKRHRTEIGALVEEYKNPRVASPPPPSKQLPPPPQKPPVRTVVVVKKEAPKSQPKPPPDRETLEQKRAVFEVMRIDPHLLEDSPVLRDLEMKLALAKDLIAEKGWQEILVETYKVTGSVKSPKEVVDLVRRYGGVAEFLMHVGYPPRFAQLVEDLRKAKEEKTKK